MNKIVGMIAMLLLGTGAIAQVKTTTDTKPVATPVAKPKIKTPPKDGYAVRTDIDSNVMVPYADVREEDVYYAKRIWREIDLRDTINSVLKAENAKLIDVLFEAVSNEELTVYSSKDTTAGKILEDNDSFRIALTARQALENARGVTEGEADAVTGKIAEPTLRRLRSDEFLKFRIKEAADSSPEFFVPGSSPGEPMCDDDEEGNDQEDGWKRVGKADHPQQKDMRI